MKRIHSPLALILLAAVLAAALSGCPKKQTVANERDYNRKVTVAQSGRADYKTITEALADARRGWLIEVRAGVYEEEVKIETDEVTLRGAGPGKTVIDADDSYAALTIEGDNVVVEGLALRGASSHGVYVKGKDAVVRRCLITGNGDRGVYFSFMGGSPSAVIDHCTVADNKVSGLYIPTQNSRTAVTNTIIARNGRGVVCDKDDRSMKFDYNCLDNKGDNYNSVTPGRHDIQKDPRFTDPGDGDYTLKKNSPCIGAAKDDTNIGCF